MMSNITYLSGWKPELCIELDLESNNKADFNRLLVKGIPSTKQLQQGEQFEDTYRESFILQIKARFDEAIKEGASHRTMYALFHTAFSYLKWCDEQSVKAFTQRSLEGYMSYQNNRVMLGEFKSSSYCVIRSQMDVIFTRYLELPHSYFDNVVVRDRRDTEPFEAYTKSDLNQLLPFLRALFKQTYQQFIEDPDKHITVYKCVPTMTFQWKGQQYPLCSAITKMMCAATHLLAYYTYTNTSDLLQLKHPDNASMTMGEVWFTMPAFKRRAFKTIHVEIGGHDLEIPKYALDFFDKLLDASKRINEDKNAVLLQTVVSKKVQPLKPYMLQSLCSYWAEKHFTFTDQTGRRLRPVISRFRETGAQLTAYHQGELANDIMLHNTPKTRKRHYSVGNKIANNGMIQDTITIREEQIKSKINIEQAQEKLGIKVLIIEEENRISLPALSRTPNGSSCNDPFGRKSEKFTRKAQKNNLIKEGERLACAELLACFDCSDQVIVQSVSDIWCLLSFKTCIEESLYLHLDASHYRQNFEHVIQSIEQKILPHIDRRILKQAQEKLDDDGLHPVWDDSESLVILIPKTTQELE